MLLLKLLIFEPFFKALIDVVLTNLKHIFRILATSFLQAPRGWIVEVKIVVNVTPMVTGLSALEVVAFLHSWVGSQRSLDRVSVCVEVFLVTAGLEIGHGITADRVPTHMSITTDSDIDDYVLHWVDNLQALFDSGVDVYVPYSATVHKNHTFVMLRWEDHGDRARCEANLRQLLKWGILLIENLIVTCVLIHCRDCESSLDLFEWSDKVSQELHGGARVKDALLLV